MTTGLLGRAWDAFDAYLFDIDGTLLHCTDATHYFAFCNTLKEVSGLPLTLEGVTAHGNTDVGILRDALMRAGIPDDVWRPRLPELRKSMCGYVERRRAEVCAEPLPKAHEVLRHLAARGAKLGVATGNLKRIGELKLRQAGLLHYFVFAQWSDEFEFRTPVICAALARARAMVSPDATLCVVGDTPADIAAARANGVAVIAVATGIYSYDDLSAAKPELCIHTLGDLLYES